MGRVAHDPLNRIINVHWRDVTFPYSRSVLTYDVTYDEFLHRTITPWIIVGTFDFTGDETTDETDAQIQASIDLANSLLTDPTPFVPGQPGNFGRGDIYLFRVFTSKSAFEAELAVQFALPGNAEPEGVRQDDVGGVMLALYPTPPT